MESLSALFDLNAPWWHFPLRAALIYISVLVLMRLAGKRAVGEFTPFDLVVVILLGESMQSGLVPEEKSVVASLLAGTTLIGLNYLFGFISTRSRKFDSLVEGDPVVLVRNGKVIEQALKNENVPRGDLEEAMRRFEVIQLADVRLAVLETDGEITIIPRKKS